MSLKAALLAGALSLTALPALAFGPQDYTAKEVTVQGMVGYLTVKVDDSVSKVTATVTGPAKQVSLVKVTLEGTDLVIEQESRQRSMRWQDKDDWITIDLRVPTGTKLEIDEFVGEGTVGNLRAALSVDGMTAGSLTVGSVTTADVGIDGSGDVKISDIDRDVSVSINGSGSVNAGRTAGKLDLQINGSGDVDIATISGAVKVEINGSGDVNLRGGIADPLDIDINGSGSVLVDGVARNQSIQQSGSGTVRITGRAG